MTKEACVSDVTWEELQVLKDVKRELAVARITIKSLRAKLAYARRARGKPLRVDFYDGRSKIKRFQIRP